MTFDVPIEDYGITDADNLFTVPGRCSVACWYEDKSWEVLAFNVDFLNLDTSMKLSQLYLIRYNADRQFKRRVNALVEDYVEKMLADEEEIRAADIYERRTA